MAKRKRPRSLHQAPSLSIQIAMKGLWLPKCVIFLDMDLAQIRRLVIVAMFSDDELLNQLTLKGGNALNLVYRLGSRASVDVDPSLEQDFADVKDAQKRIFRSLKNRFREAGMIVFDEKLLFRPENPRADGNERLGGYEITFKLMDSKMYDAISDNTQRQRESIVVGPLQQRTFRVQISKYEYCVGKRETELDDYTISVYTPEMLAIEKLRAICQQMPDYSLRSHHAPRARDFYDIHSIITGTNIDLGTPLNLQLARDIFAAKEVPLVLIPRIPEYRRFHKEDWPAVVVSASGKLGDFDSYFDFVLNQTRLLETLWKE
jgi:Nucleotidyl transferase AbiEii toxin, Type IV TA system